MPSLALCRVLPNLGSEGVGVPLQTLSYWPLKKIHYIFRCQYTYLVPSQQVRFSRSKILDVKGSKLQNSTYGMHNVQSSREHGICIKHLTKCCNWCTAPQCTITNKPLNLSNTYTVQKGAVTKSYMRKGFLIHEEAVSHIWLCNCSLLNFLIYEENSVHQCIFTYSSKFN